VRTLSHPSRIILQRHSIDSFLVSTRQPLGRLNHLRIWHDNSGSSSDASWFLKYVLVQDLQTEHKSHFICQQWLAVEKGDGLVGHACSLDP
jgi:polycystin 1L2